jgi:predicted transposase YbfD/YdcC
LVDERDNRGKRHNLAFVLTGMLIALLRTGKRLNIASIQRWMQREHAQLVAETGCESKKAISDVQLRRLLAGLDYGLYNQVNETYFGKSVYSSDSFWQAIDGKELRGSIDKLKGEKRGENVVRAVSHQGLQSRIIAFYQGSKESEKTVVKNYFDEQITLSGGYSMDALHCYAALLETIAEKGGIYLVQVKSNQEKLLEECEQIAQQLPCKQAFQTIDKAHGRMEQRQAKLYELNVECLEPRWHKTAIQTLVVIDRQRLRLKDGQESGERAYFITNQTLTGQAGADLFEAVRKHWSVEIDNHVRDVTLGEDYIICRESNRMRSVASIINTGLNLIRRHNTNNNFVALREELNFDRQKAINCLSPHWLFL